jgi:hypothetical protein
LRHSDPEDLTKVVDITLKHCQCNDASPITVFVDRTVLAGKHVEGFQFAGLSCQFILGNRVAARKRVFTSLHGRHMPADKPLGVTGKERLHSIWIVRSGRRKVPAPS